MTRQHRQPPSSKTFHRYEGTNGELMRTHASMLSRAFIPPCIIADVSRKTAALGPAPAFYAGRNPSCLQVVQQTLCQDDFGRARRHLAGFRVRPFRVASRFSAERPKGRQLKMFIWAGLSSSGRAAEAARAGGARARGEFDTEISAAGDCLESAGQLTKTA